MAGLNDALENVVVVKNYLLARAEYAMTFISFSTAQQYAHELGEITGERWEVRKA